MDSEKKFKIQVLIGLGTSTVLLLISSMINIGEYDDQNDQVTCNITLFGQSTCIPNGQTQETSCQIFNYCKSKRAIAIFSFQTMIFSLLGLLMFIIEIGCFRNRNGWIKFYKKLKLLILLIGFTLLMFQLCQPSVFESQIIVSPIFEYTSVLCFLWMIVIFIIEIWQEHKEDKEQLIEMLERSRGRL